MSTVEAGRGRLIIRGSAPLLVSAALVLLLVPAALTSIKLAILCLGLVGIVLLSLVFGASQVGSGCLLIAFGTVNFDTVHVTGSLRIADPFFFLGFVLLLPRLIGTPLRLPTAFKIGALGFAALGLVAAVATDHAGGNLNYFFQVARGVILIPILLAWWQPRTRTLTAAAFAYVLGNCVSVIASLINGPIGGHRYEGLASAPNLMAYGQALSLSLMPFLVATLPRRLRPLVGVFALTCAYGVYLSGSRGALLGAVLLTVLYPVLMRSIPAALGVMALCAPALVAVSNSLDNPSSTNVLGRLLGGQSGQASNEVRTETAQFGLNQFFGHPLLGDGWLTIWGVHIGYLQIAAAIGIFGLAFYLLLLSSVLRPLLTLPSPYRLLAVPALTATMLDLVLPVVGAMFEWTAVGLALCAAPLAARERRLARLEPSSKEQEPD